MIASVTDSRVVRCSVDGTGSVGDVEAPGPRSGFRCFASPLSKRQRAYEDAGALEFHSSYRRALRNPPRPPQEPKAALRDAVAAMDLERQEAEAPLCAQL